MYVEFIHINNVCIKTFHQGHVFAMIKYLFVGEAGSYVISLYMSFHVVTMQDLNTDFPDLYGRVNVMGIK